MQQSTITRETGFTILELMVVLTIAGILLTLAEPSFSNTIHKAREASLQQNLFTIRDVIDQYRADTGKYPPTLADLKSSGYLKRIPMDPFTKSTLWARTASPITNGKRDGVRESNIVCDRRDGSAGRRMCQRSSGRSLCRAGWASAG